MKQGAGFIRNTIKGLKMIFHAEPKMFIIKCLLCIAHGISWALQVVFAQRFFDTAHQLVRQEVELNVVIYSMIAMILAYIFTQVINGADSAYGNIFKLAFDKHKELNLKILKVWMTLIKQLLVETMYFGLL